MKTIGLIGGMSWESTVHYYQIINEYIKKSLGGLHSAKIILYSVEFDEIERCQSENRWDDAAAILGDAAKSLERAGADFILICTNTMHKEYPRIQSAVNIPVIHIAQATSDALKNAGIKKVGLLGTKYTMLEDFYKGILRDNGFEVEIPDEKDIEELNRIIFEELCVGIIKDESRDYFRKAIISLKDKGCEGVILGCTEIGMLINAENSALPVFDTTIIHAEKAAELSIRIGC